jgi:hypothetical protein
VSSVRWCDTPAGVPRGVRAGLPGSARVRPARLSNVFLAARLRPCRESRRARGR